MSPGKNPYSICWPTTWDGKARTLARRRPANAFVPPCCCSPVQPPAGTGRWPCPRRPHWSLAGLEQTTSAQTYTEAARLLAQTSLRLTQGQYLDLAYESMENLKLDDYWPMVWAKTGVLIRTCVQFGTLLAGISGKQAKAFSNFSEKLGLAYQVHDDLLGIWGDPAEMGKSAHSDLLSGKKSLPILYALQKNGAFARRWVNGGVPEAELAEL